MNDKYELVNQQDNGLWQIKALRDFGSVKKGDLGGFIAQESNLSVFNNAWVFNNARVFSNARVYGDARVFDDARVFSNARVFGDAIIYGTARVYGDARVFGNAIVFGDAIIYGTARVSKNIFYLSYDTYIITITDNHIAIGCEQHTKEVWFNFDDKTIDAMDSEALVWWKKWKPILKLVIEDKE